MPNRCRICCDPKLSAQAQMWALAGVADREVGRRLGLDKSLVNRHRIKHILEPLQHQLALAGRGAEPQRQREKLAAAVVAGEPSTQDLVEAVLGLRSQMAKMSAIEQRLERMAAVAENQGAATVVAALAGQQLRGVEVGARLASLPAFVPQRMMGEVAPGTTFAVNILFSDGKQETISVATPTVPRTPVDQGATGVYTNDHTTTDEDHQPEYDPLGALDD
jgi:hypothetical protein